MGENNKELKRCPFCDSSVHMNVNDGIKPPYGFIICNGCNITLSLYHTHDPDLVIRAWNNRVTDTGGCSLCEKHSDQ